MFAFVVFVLVFFSTKPRDWLGSTSPKCLILCRVGRKTLTQSINYACTVVAYEVLLGRAPSYLGPLVRVADVSGRRALCSAVTNRILVLPVMSTIFGSRAFSVSAPLIWNSLPDDIISTESLPTFQRKLKRHLFCQSFPGFCY